jgi:hypothetical protein
MARDFDMRRDVRVARRNGGTALKRIFGMTAFAAALVYTGYAAAQALAFDTRFSTAPVDARSQAAMTGEGHVMVTLSGNRLVVEGAFEGLQRPATTAHLHLGAAKGVRGPSIHALEVTRATHGVVAASIQLSAEHVDALRAGRIYIQIDGEETPEGNLWAWLVP